MRRIYFDHSATTAVEPAVVEKMLPYFSDIFGNASSIHAFGQIAKKALDEAREFIASMLHAKPTEIIFTSSGTESDNLALKGLAWAEKKRRHIITSVVEHHAVLRTCEYLEKKGFQVTYLPVDHTGLVAPEAVRVAITPATFLISIMHANNEVGTINPIHEIGAIAREHGCYFHCDAVQTFGKIPIDVNEIPVDFLTFSGHKIYGPKGTGVLYARKGISFEKLNHGGHHEYNHRGGTENLAGIVGLAEAARLCQASMDSEQSRIGNLRDQLFEKLQASIPKVKLNGHPTQRLAGHLNLAFEGIEGEALLLSLDLKGIAASSGSACTSGATEPSHVLLAMGVPAVLAQSSLRFTLGRHNTRQDVDTAAEVLPEIVKRLRSISPFSK